jgi:hypothetical protein
VELGLRRDRVGDDIRDRQRGLEVARPAHQDGKRDGRGHEGDGERSVAEQLAPRQRLRPARLGCRRLLSDARFEGVLGGLHGGHMSGI